jgi:uncharacterized protein DUF6551
MSPAKTRTLTVPTEVTRRLGKITPAQCSIDLRVQRQEDPVRINTMAEDFEPLAIGVVTVSCRADESMILLDGQTRMGALRLLGGANDRVDAVLYTGLTLEQEAAMFKKLNNTKKLSELERFAVSVVEGEPEAVAINDMLTKHGFIAERGHSNSLAAIATLRALFVRDVVSTERALIVVSSGWGARREAVQRDILRGTGNLLHRYGDMIIVDQLGERLQKGAQLTPNHVIGRARTSSGLRGISVADAVADILVNTYNHNRKTNKLPTWEVTR